MTTQPKISQQKVNTATDTIVEYMYRNEDKDFRENLDDEDKKDPAKFTKALKEHILYSVVVLKYKDDAVALNEWFTQYWNDYGEPEDDEEEDEDDEEEAPETYSCQRCDLRFHKTSEACKGARIEEDEIYCGDCNRWFDKQDELSDAELSDEE